MELVSDLKVRLYKAEMAMYNSEYPEEFSEILTQNVFFEGCYRSFAEMLDRWPEYIPILIEKCHLKFNDAIRDFKVYSRDVFKMRINHGCPTGKSWKEFVENISHSMSDYNDNYSQHEIM